MMQAALVSKKGSWSPCSTSARQPKQAMLAPKPLRPDLTTGLLADIAAFGSLSERLVQYRAQCPVPRTHILSSESSGASSSRISSHPHHLLSEAPEPRD